MPKAWKQENAMKEVEDDYELKEEKLIEDWDADKQDYLMMDSWTGKGGVYVSD